MTRSDLATIAESAKCRILGWEDAATEGHRSVLAAIINAFNTNQSAILCEPSLARNTCRPPDIVLIDPEIGVQVVEVKGIALQQIESLEAGGQIRVQYNGIVRNTNPINQVRRAMFDIKDATARAYDSELRLPFRYWVAFPLITRQAWQQRFSAGAYCPVEFLFADDLSPEGLRQRLGANRLRTAGQPTELCPLDQLRCVWQAFGDNSVLYATPEDRQQRRVDEGTLGDLFDESAQSEKRLSDEQQRLSAMNWESGPRLVRGVAGSGKTIVLANNLARRLERMQVAAQEGLFGQRPPPPRLLAVCFNRTLAPFLRQKISLAYQQRTGRDLPEALVDVCSFNTLMYRLTTGGLWQYQSVTDANDIVRAMQYLDDLVQVRQRDPDRLAALAYDAIYVDEGQDFLEEEFRLLKELCRVGPGQEPNLYVFYDDAQNLFGRSRPNWQSLGLNVRGARSHIMTQCFRNTRPIVEAAFNVLYGTRASHGAQVPTREFGDLSTLVERGLIASEPSGLWRIRFAPREGNVPEMTLTDSAQQETQAIIARLQWLIGQQQVRPQDILVLAFRNDRASQLASAIAAAALPGAPQVHLASARKDERLAQKNRLTVSTVASAKGYDAYCVLLASASEFPCDVMGRANFYVACTRAAERLEVFSYERLGLAVELESVLESITAC